MNLSGRSIIGGKALQIEVHVPDVPLKQTADALVLDRECARRNLVVNSLGFQTQVFCKFLDAKHAPFKAYILVQPVLNTSLKAYSSIPAVKQPSSRKLFFREAIPKDSSDRLKLTRIFT
jgi:hypothetical protein